MKCRFQQMILIEDVEAVAVQNTLMRFIQKELRLCEEEMETRKQSGED